jgi:hypothetical protein
MVFENFIRIAVSYGRSKAGTERTDKPHLSLLQILRPATTVVGTCHKMEDVQEEVESRKAKWLDDDGDLKTSVFAVMTY